MPVESLSGGNQQKVVLARPWLRKPEVLIVDEPTQGVDAKARLDIYQVLSQAAENGVGVLVNSSDSAELAGLCDRVYVMSRGVVVEEIVEPTSEGQIVQSFVAATDVSEAQVELRQRSGVRNWFDRLSAHTPIIVLLILITALAVYTGNSDPRVLGHLQPDQLADPYAAARVGCAGPAVQPDLRAVRHLWIGSVMSLTVVLLSFTLPDLAPGSIVKSAAVCVVAALAVGAFNALLIEALNVTPIVATVASLGVVQGIAIWLRPEYGGIIAERPARHLATSLGFIPISFRGSSIGNRPRAVAVQDASWSRAASDRTALRVSPSGRMAGRPDPSRRAVHLHARRSPGRCRPGEPGGRGCEQHR